MIEKKHKAGFVNIVGKPNAGKSTLMNRLVGEKLSIITSKAQTTRHRIMGIINSEDFQVVYSDTPGVIKPNYKLHESMMSFVNDAFEDADILLFVTDLFEDFDESDVIQRINNSTVPVILLINKTDLGKHDQILTKIDYWSKTIKAKEIIPISALKGDNTEKLLDIILKHIPEHPAYYPKDQLTNRAENFFASEIIREKIFKFCKKEIPYATEVVISDFNEEEGLIRIRAEIFVERDSQKGIIIGKGGEMLKKIGSKAREDLETFFDKKVFLEQYVKVKKDWRKKGLFKN